MKDYPSDGVKMEVGPSKFQCKFDRNTRGRPCLILCWIRATQFSNFTWERWLTFHLGPPWKTHVAAFIIQDEASV